MTKHEQIGVGAFVAALLLTVGALAAPAKAEPQSEPAVHVMLDCDRPTGVAPEKAAKMGAEDAVEWAKWANSLQSTLAFYSETAERLNELGLRLGILSARDNASKARMMYVATYTETLFKMYEGHLPADLKAVLNAGVKAGKRYVRQHGASCTEA